MDLWRSYQLNLLNFGDGHLAAAIRRDLEQVLDSDPLDPEAVERELDELHLEAFPTAKGRPARLTGAEAGDPRE